MELLHCQKHEDYRDGCVVCVRLTLTAELEALRKDINAEFWNGVRDENTKLRGEKHETGQRLLLAMAERDRLETALGGVRLALKMASDAMAADPRDWSKRRTDAWLYALLIGWGGEALREVVQLHGSAFHGADGLMPRALGDKPTGIPFSWPPSDAIIPEEHRAQTLETVKRAHASHHGHVSIMPESCAWCQLILLAELGLEYGPESTE